MKPGMEERTGPAANPLRQGMRRERIPDPCTMVIFGATGDLTRRKLLPALLGLEEKHLLSPGFSVVGFARSRWSDVRFRSEIRKSLGEVKSAETWDEISPGIRYLSGDPTRQEDFERLAQFDHVSRQRRSNP